MEILRFSALAAVSLIVISISPSEIYESHLIDVYGSSNPRDLFAPYAFLQTAPAPLDSIYMSLNLINFSKDTENSVTFHDPNTLISNLSSASQAALLHGQEVVPSFDSYYRVNRFMEQTIPAISNMSLVFSQVSNPTVAQEYPTLEISQVEVYPNSTVIENPSQGTDKYLFFEIPSNITEDYYLVDLRVHFPQYDVTATYSNLIEIISEETAQQREEELQDLIETFRGMFGDRDGEFGSPDLPSTQDSGEFGSPDLPSTQDSGEFGSPDLPSTQDSGEFGSPYGNAT
jgi:hypothetical protein